MTTIAMYDRTGFDRSMAAVASEAVCKAFIDAVSTCQVKTNSVASVTCFTTQKTTYCDANDYFPIFVPNQIIHEARPHNAELLNKCGITSISYKDCPAYVQTRYTLAVESAVEKIVKACVVRARSLCAGESQVQPYDGKIFPAMVDGNSGATHSMEK